MFTEDEAGYARSAVKVLFDLGFDHPLRCGNTMDCLHWFNDNFDEIESTGLSLSMYTGATKIVITDSRLKRWVIKIGIIDEDSDTECTDFCSVECDNYRKACDNKLQEYFAETYYLGEVCDVDVYLQEFAPSNEDRFSDAFCEYVSDQSMVLYCDDEDEYRARVFDQVCELDNDERLMAVFGEDIAPLIEFIEENDINDLHEGNYGITEDGRVVIIDFSGYF